MPSINAQIWLGGSDFEYATIPAPVLNAGDRLVEMRISAVCGSDRHTVSGRRTGIFPSVLGHEGVGTIVSGPGCRKRVVFSVTSVCGSCENCRRGLSAKCTQVRKVGHEPYLGQWGLSGTFASHIVLPPSVTVVEVPETIPDKVAAIAGCSVATVMAAMDSAGRISGRNVFISGLGMLGLVAVQAAQLRGARTVFAFDPSKQRMSQARALGAQPMTKGEEIDVSLEFSGASAGVRSAVETLAIGGRAVLVGSVAPAGTIDIDPEWMVRGWRTITGVHNYEPRHLQEAIDFLDIADLPWQELLSGPIPLANLPQEFLEPQPGLRTLVETS